MNVVNQKSQPAHKLQPQNIQTAASTEGFLWLTDANPFFFFFQRKETSDKEALNILK